jgi:transposase
MEVLYRRCAGLDVHQAQITACVRVTPEESGPWAQARQFDTTPGDLGALRAWLTSHGVTHVAMEGTGVYWLPVFTELELGDFDLTLCNAHHVKNVPGRKSDQSDAAWLAQLLASGLLRKSFVPEADVREVRELTRARVHRVEDRTRVVNGLHRLFERVGIKLCSVVSDLQGKSARAIMQAMMDGQTDATALAGLARGSLRRKRAQLAEVLSVPLQAADRMLLGQSLAQLTLYDGQISALNEQVEILTRPWKAALDLALTAPAVDAISAPAIIAEISPDVAAFETSKNIGSWAKACPGQKESAGKRKRVGTGRGNPYLMRILVQLAMVIARTKKNPSDLTAFFRRKVAVLGYKKALVATAHKLLVRLWAMLRYGQPYKAPEPPQLTERQRARRAKRAFETLAELGIEVVQREPSTT